MSHGIEVALACVLLIAGSVWVGGYVAIGVVARVTVRTLGPADRVAFFRALGRMYGIVGTVALALALLEALLDVSEIALVGRLVRHDQSTFIA